MLTVDDNKNFDWKAISLKDCLEGNAMDTHYTGKIYFKLLEELRAKGLEKLYDKLISPATIVFRDLEYEGMLIDPIKLQQLKLQIETKITELTEKLNASEGIPPGANFNSSHDLVKILFSLEKNENKEWVINEQFGFGLYPTSKTSTGQPQTNVESMTELKDLVDKEFSRRGLNEKVSV